MKKIFVAVFIITCFQVSLAQLYAPGTVQGTSNSSTGKVGIGTATPEVKLDIANAQGSGLQFRYDQTPAYRISLLPYWNSSTDTRLDFNIGRQANAGPITVMSVGYGGNVGVGTIVPDYKLDVEGNGARIKNSQSVLGAYTTFRIQGPNYAHGLEIDFFGNNNIASDPNWSYGGGAGSAAIMNVNPKPLIFGTNNTDRMMIDASGNVGIGTRSPQGYLHVNPVRPVIIKNNGGNGIYGSEIGFNAVLNTSIVPNTFRKLGGTSQAGGASIAVDYEGNMLFQMYNAGTESESIINFSPQVSFLNNGNVGIGISSPDAKLAVRGDIHTQEVKVDLTGAVAPDYVFEKDYNLLPLSELEAYINQNRHLPEVPSAKEMEANGLNLKEMNLLLLKKVEELTLHLIEQQKTIDSQNKRIEKLEKVR